MSERSIMDELNNTPVEAEIVEIENVSRETKKGIDLSFLKTPTGAGAIGDYMEHPMNFNNSKGMARLLRGLTGVLGNLDLAIVDIAVGLLDLLKTNKKAVGVNGGNGVHLPS